MIFVSLGTQDMPFTRLLQMVEEAIQEGTIQEKVIAQVGCTPYTGSLIETFQYCDQATMDAYVEQANYLITHGGTGSIIGALKKGKKVIAVSRLSKYGEHNNDHQTQIISQFSDTDYILECKEGEALSDVIKRLQDFQPQTFISNTQNVLAFLEEYIEGVLGGKR